MRGESWGYTNRCLLYHILSGEMEEIPSLENKVQRHIVYLKQGNSIAYIIGGEDGFVVFDKCYALDLRDHSNSHLGTLHNKRYKCGAFQFDDDWLYVYGGCSWGHGEIISKVERINLKIQCGFEEINFANSHRLATRNTISIPFDGKILVSG